VMVASLTAIVLRRLLRGPPPWLGGLRNAVLYLLVALRGRLFRPDPPLAAPPVDASRLTSLSAPPSDTGVSALRWSGRAARPTDSLTA